MPCADDFVLWLQNNGVGTDAVDLFAGTLPAFPDKAVAILEYPGEPSVYVHGRIVKPRVTRPRVQVFCRAQGRDIAVQLAADVHRALDLAGVTLFGTRYLRVEPLQDPYFLERDNAAVSGGDRFTYTFNVRVEKEST
jgi:hypothetical protein